MKAIYNTERLLVCGGRDYEKVRYVFSVLSGLKPRPLLLIQGGNKGTRRDGKFYPGADLIARIWAELSDVPNVEYAVDHVVDGPWPAAGPRRNQRMLEKSKPTLGMAFPGGRGTADMVRRMKAAGLHVIEVA